MATPNTRQLSGIGSPRDSGKTSAPAWQCPDCHSTDLVRLSLVYLAGVSEINGRTRGRGLGLGENGIAVTFSGAKVSGTLQTQLSRNANPPHKRRYRYYIVAWLLGFYLALCIAVTLKTGQPGNAAHVHQGFIWFSWMYCAFLIWMLGVLWHYNHGIYRQRYREWHRSFMCRRCGKTVRVDSHA